MAEDYTDRDEWPTQRLAELRAQLAEEIGRRRRLDAAVERYQKVTDRIARDVEREPVREYAGDTWLPGQVMTVDGVAYRNVSGVILSTGPAGYPMGFQLATPPAEAAPWTEDEEVAADDLRQYQGVVYKALQAHRTQLGWEPPAVPALWAVA